MRKIITDVFMGLTSNGYDYAETDGNSIWVLEDDDGDCIATLWQPGFRCKLNVDCPDGTVEPVLSDSIDRELYEQILGGESAFDVLECF